MGKNLFVEVLSIVFFHAVIAFNNIGATMWLGVAGVAAVGIVGRGAQPVHQGRRRGGGRSGSGALWSRAEQVVIVICGGLAPWRGECRGPHG